MWPVFRSQHRRLMWVEFVVGSLLCSERFFSGYSGFPLCSKTNISKFQFDQDQVDEEPLSGCAISPNPYLLFISPCKRRCRHCLPIALQLRGRGSAGFCGAVLKPSPLSCNRSQDRVPATWCYFFFFSLPLYLFFLLAFSHLFPIPNSFSIFLSLKLGEDGRDACLFS